MRSGPSFAIMSSSTQKNRPDPRWRTYYEAFSAVISAAGPAAEPDRRFTITGDTTDTSPEGKQEEPEKQHLTADVDETQVWQRTAGAPWTGGEPQTVSADFERISGAAAQGMTVGQELLLLDFMDCYYQSVADLRVIDPAVLFADSEETLYHKNIWHGLCVIRKLSPIDLTMTSYSYYLRCVSITPSEETEGDVDMVLRENNVVYFKGLNSLPSEQFGIKHTFTLRGEGDDWSIVKHWSDDNPYYSADYDRTTHQDKNFPAITDYIEARRDLPREGLSVTAAADHPYDRDAAGLICSPGWASVIRPSWLTTTTAGTA